MTSEKVALQTLLLICHEYSATTAQLNEVNFLERKTSHGCLKPYFAYSLLCVAHAWSDKLAAIQFSFAQQTAFLLLVSNVFPHVTAALSSTTKQLHNIPFYSKLP